MKQHPLRRGAGLLAAGVAALALTVSGAGVALAAPPPVAMISELSGVSTSVKLDQGFVSALQSLNVAPGPSGRATVSGGTATFPITGGNLTVYPPGSVDPYVQGRIMHEGSGLTLTKGDTKVVLENFVVDPGNPATLTGKVTANGTVAGDSVKLFDLDGSTLKPLQTDKSAGTATLTGTTVKLSDDAAKALNGVFKTDALKGGTTVGIATIVVKLPGQSGQTSPTPSGGANTGGGGTSGMEDAGLLAAGLVALLGAAATAVYALRRRSHAGAAR